MEIDDFGGVDAIISRIRDRVGTTNPVMLSFDIDVIDPSMAVSVPNPIPALTNEEETETDASMFVLCLLSTACE